MTRGGATAEAFEAGLAADAGLYLGDGLEPRRRNRLGTLDADLVRPLAQPLQRGGETVHTLLQQLARGQKGVEVSHARAMRVAWARASEALEGLAYRVTEWTGGSWAFGVALATIVAWGVTGPIFGFSDTWQLVINTGTTILTLR
jgi:hypothetical protein